MKTTVVRRGSCTVFAAVIWLAASPNLLASERLGERKTRDITELLVNPHPAEVEVGERLLAAQRPVVIKALLQRVKMGSLEDKRRTAYQLGLVLSPWIRGKEAGARSYGATSFPAPRRPVERQPDLAEGREIRSVLQQVIAALLVRQSSDSKQASLKEEALIALRKTLVEVANDDTMEWVIDLLSQIKSPEQTEFLIELADRCLGVPKEYYQSAICGNSSPAEFGNAARYEKSAATLARRTLAESWSRVREMSQKNRTAFAIARWSKFFATRDGEDPHDDNSLNDWFFLQMESLVRLGGRAVPALRSRQAQQKTLRMRAMWEVPIATITGREDQSLVRELLQGNSVEAALACEIIVAAGSKRWLNELNELQKRKDFSRNRASEAIASCFRVEGIPALKRGLAADRKNYSARYSLEELAQWAKRGAPNEMWGYEYRKTDE